ncbi:unnamed protein product [Urochloa decumbens]|uniref:DUF4220 domain-containing protein n=1 Tax=Urochloa decumbens TaxID=240449 RepID=A0ABC8VZL4_9POAL
MVLSSAVRRWDEWQLRVLVLASLAVQYFLAIFGGRRKSRIPPWYRFFIWLSYLGSDALAIYALATLFNRRKKIQYSNGSRDLEVLWAPILLMHLGGQMFITAYNIEDNELWKRHILTTVSQVTVALYVFGKSWSSSADTRLLAAAILLFVPGVLKCFEKPLALKAASFNSLVSSFHRAQKAAPKSREEELDEFIRTAKAYFQGADTTKNPPVNLSVPHKLFVDFSYPYSDRLKNLKYFLSLWDDAAYREIETGLSNIFDLLYTKNKLNTRANAVAICCCYWTWSLTVPLAIVAIGLFHSSHKESYNHNDVTVTLVMMYGTLMLDIVSALILKLAYDVKVPDVITQHRLLGFFIRKKKFNMTAIGCFLQSCCNIVLIDQYCFNMGPSYLSKEITKLVLRHVKDGWTHYIKDAWSYRKFNDAMGQWTLERGGHDKILGWSLEKPFDEVVLVWHLATDFCFHSTSAKSSHPNIADYPSRDMGRAISNYMMHLLFDNPEMLMAGSRKNLFMTAYEELERILRNVELQLVDDEEKLALEVMDKVRSKHTKNKIKSKRGFFVHDAWLLSECLMGLGDDKKMWDVIRDVWVEILCFSSGRCRGYLHAKSLGSGVPLLCVAPAGARRDGDVP